MTHHDAHGPIDFLILEFPAGSAGDASAKALLDLVEGGTIRLYDLMVLHKATDGSCREIDVATAADGSLVALERFSAARSGLLGGDDVQEAAGVLEPGTTAAVIVYENAWAIPFVSAARTEGAQLVASARLTAQQIMDAIDAVETAS